MRFVLAAAAALLALTLARGSAASSTNWKLHDLGALLHLNMSPIAINDRGEIVGSAHGAGVAGRAFLWRGGRFVDLGTCGGYSAAVDINARGDVVGSCGFRPGGKPDHAFLWRNGKAIDLGTGGSDSSDAVAINDRDQVIGNRFLHGDERAFLWASGTMRDLGTLGGTKSEATALNDAGEVVGDSTTASGQQHAFLWRDGRMTDLGVLRGGASTPFGGVAREQFEPRAINAHGTIVGLAHDPFGSYETSFIWRRGRLSAFGTFGGQPSRAIAINDHGQVLVQTTPPTDKRGDAYLWQNRKFVKLPSFDSDQPATFATGLNSNGVVVGRSLVAIGHMRPFVWTGGHLTPLPTPNGTGPPFTFVAGVNDRGVIVGAGPLHLATWTH